MSKGTILAVDDESQIREVCQRTLERLGFDVKVAGTGEQAVALLRDHEFDFVLTDIKMPGSIDGPMLAGEVKRISPSTDVVIMTGYPTVNTAIESLKQGAYDYLLKPFGPEYLDSVVTRCFEKRRLSKELDREKLMRRELEAAYSEIQKVEQIKDAFLARLHHELRTPLTIALMAAEVAGAQTGQPEQREDARQMLVTKLAGLHEILEDLLLYSEMHSNDLRPKQSAVNVPELLTGIADKYRSLCEEKGLKVDISFAEPFPLLQADPSLLGTALKHLLLNAIHFNKTGGSITVRGEASAEEARISFRDTGIGMPQDQLSKLFGSFYQAAEHLTRKVGGLGLGLAIVRRIAEAHGGRVSVQSEHEKGSEFLLTLPAAASTEA